MCDTGEDEDNSEHGRNSVREVSGGLANGTGEGMGHGVNRPNQGQDRVAGDDDTDNREERDSENVFHGNPFRVRKPTYRTITPNPSGRSN